MVEERAKRNRSSEHLLEAKRLSTELDRRMRAARRADLVLDGVRTVPTEFDDVGPTAQSEPFGPKRDPAEDPCVRALRCLRRVDHLVGEPASDRVDVLVERLHDVD